MRSIAARTVIACAVLFACAGAAHAERPAERVAAWQPPFAAPSIDIGGEGPLQPDNGEVSCTGTSYCAMTGIVAVNGSGFDITAYVWDKANGSWDTARQVPGLAAMNKGENATANAISCAAPGNCAAGGSYSPYADEGYELEPFVASEANGVWLPAHAVTGLPGIDEGDSTQVDQVSCPAPGDCTAAGAYNADNYKTGTFVLEETDGRWGKALTLPSIDPPGGTSIASMSCPSRGNCAVAGDDLNEDGGGFIIDEAGGHWGRPQWVPGIPAGDAYLASVSCPSAGDCVAVGTDSAGKYPDGAAFEVTEQHGHWGSARLVPGTGASSVSCPADGDCTAVTGAGPGDIAPGSGDIDAEVNGVWRRPLHTPDYIPAAVSCPAPGYCSATGYYEPADALTAGHSAIGLIDETAGRWGPWNLLRQTIAYYPEPAPVVDPLSCGAPGNCALHGYHRNQDYGYAVNEWAAATSLVPATATALALSSTRLGYGREQAVRFSVTVLASSGTPAGLVDVMSGQTTLCTVRLSAGRGSCTAAATRLPAGAYRPAAYYGISAGFAPSHSGRAGLVIVKAATVTRLALTHPSVGYGGERSELIKVSVTPRYAGDPVGSVTVMTGKTRLCTIRLSARKGSCVLGAETLPPGRFRLTARYAGSGDFVPSKSAPSWLVVRSG